MNPSKTAPIGEQAFVDLYGGVYENSPWIVRQLWRETSGQPPTNVHNLATALAKIVNAADAEQQLKLIRAHPDLAGRAALAGELTSESRSEQASAGLDQCTAEELERFKVLNTRYRTKFEFPFIMAVKGANRHKILAGFTERLENERDTELARAMTEVHKIALLRLKEIAGVAQTNPFHQWINLAQPRLGTKVVFATDEFFAAKERLIDPSEPVFIADKYDDHGKWMDGWESRRKRTPGHDYCVIRLGVTGMLHGLDINTRFFTGNYPPAASLAGCISTAKIPGPETEWEKILSETPLNGDSQHLIPIDRAGPFTHLRFSIYPDGGVARLRLYGEVSTDPASLGNAQIDLLALEHGGRALICNDEHFGSMHNLNVPGRGINMGDGWETARRRGPGNDWVILALGTMGNVDSIEVDTAHFKGNYPDRVAIDATRLDDAALDGLLIPEALADDDITWLPLLPESKLEMDKQHYFSELNKIGPVTHIRMRIFPDGGISRLRVLGKPVSS